MLYGYIFIIIIDLVYVLIRNNSVWQQFHIFRVAEDVDPYNAR